MEIDPEGIWGVRVLLTGGLPDHDFKDCNLDVSHSGVLLVRRGFGDSIFMVPEGRWAGARVLLNKEM